MNWFSLNESWKMSSAPSLIPKFWLRLHSGWPTLVILEEDTTNICTLWTSTGTWNFSLVGFSLKKCNQRGHASLPRSYAKTISVYGSEAWTNWKAHGHPSRTRLLSRKLLSLDRMQRQLAAIDQRLWHIERHMVIPPKPSCSLGSNK